jgi:surface-anchored protein
MKNTLLYASLLLIATSTHAASTYTGGHADLGIAHEAGVGFDLHIHFHTGAIIDGVPLVADDEFDPADIVTTTSTSSARPAGAGFDFIGTSAGSPIFTLPEIESLGIPFLGIGSEELDPLEWTSLSIRLTGVVASNGGHFSLWKDDGFGGATVFMQSSNGFDIFTDTLALTAGDHEHFNWTFSTWGNYELTFEVSGIHSVDGLVTGQSSYFFQAIPEPSRALLLMIGLTGTFFRRRRP